MSLFQKRIFKPWWIILILLFIYLFKSFLFDNSFEFNLDASLILPLRVFQPYLGAELSYLTRSNGGFAVALKPGALVELQEVPIQLNFFGLARYDVFNALFGTQALNQLLLGAGLDVMFRIWFRVC